MSKYDAERAFKIYKTFSKQTDQVVQFLSVARQYENATRLEIPKLKHAPTSLTSSLEEYLNDADFEVNRRQYLAQQDAKKGKKPTAGTATKSDTNKHVPNKDLPGSKPATSAPAAKIQEAKGPAPDLIDFFDSIEEKQQPMAFQPQQMPPIQNGSQYFQQPSSSAFPSATQAPFRPDGQPQQQQINPMSNPYAGNNNQVQLATQPDFTGTSFGGFSQQPFGQQPTPFPSLPQTTSTEGFPQQQQQFNSGPQSFNIGPQSQQSTNPFRQSSMPTGASTSSFTNPPSISSPLSQQGTNPFARSTPSVGAGQSQSSPFTSAPPQQPPQSFPVQSSQFFSQQAPSPMQPRRTGTNPFARNVSSPSSQVSTPPPLMANATGSTNPFRQSTFVNQQTGQSWQSNQGSMGGLEQFPTVPVFPRLGQQAQQQAQQQQPWP
ncbi:MAG: hypothetical protein Q9216_005997 [Gyalolechia sp. 2 TL-2023]